MKDMDRPTGTRDRLAELVSAREKEMAPQRAVALPIFEKVAYVLGVTVGIPIVLVIGLAMALFIPVAVVVAWAGLAPSAVFSLLAGVISQGGYPSAAQNNALTTGFPVLAVGSHHAGPQHGLPPHLFHKLRVGQVRTLRGCGSGSTPVLQRAPARTDQRPFRLI